MRSVRQASGALDELAKLMPDTAERIRPDGSTETVPVGSLRSGDLVLVRPGASVPGRRRGGRGRVGRQRGDDHRRVPAGQEAPGRAGHRRHDQRRRQPAGAGSPLPARRPPWRASCAWCEQAQQSKSRTQVLADKAAGWLFYIALAVAALTAIAWTIAIGLQRGGDRAGGDRAGDCLPARAGAGHPAGGRHHHHAGRAATASWCATGWRWKRRARSTW